MTAPPLPVVEHAAPADTGCDWRRLDSRFARCLTCPLPRCRYEYPHHEQFLAAQLVQELMRPGQPARPARVPRTRPARQQPTLVMTADPDHAHVLQVQQTLIRGRSRPQPGGPPDPVSERA